MAKYRNKTVRAGAPKRRMGLGVFLGIFIGLGVAIAVTFYVNQATQRIGDNHDVVGSSVQPGQDLIDDEVDFDFYKLLPGEGRAPDLSGEARNRKDVQGGTIYYIQVAALSNASEADNLKARLAMNGFESRIQSIETPEGKLLHRVRIGPYETENEAEKIKVEMVEFNFDVTVVKVTDAN